MAALRVATGKALGLGLGRRHGHFRRFQSFSLPDLPYDYGALEPVISAEIMQLHHQKHHQTYVSNYNTALEQLEHALSNGDSPTVVRLQSAIKFNGGDFSILLLHTSEKSFRELKTKSVRKSHKPLDFLEESRACQRGGERPKDSLFWAIDTQFGSLETLIQKVNAEGAALQGSGWVWLALDKEQKKLSVETTANQDPLVTKGSALVPLFGIDVWEHAYYLQYNNAKADYLTNIWKVMNWKYASEVYEKENP